MSEDMLASHDNEATSSAVDGDDGHHDHDHGVPAELFYESQNAPAETTQVGAGNATNYSDLLSVEAQFLTTWLGVLPIAGLSGIVDSIDNYNTWDQPTVTFSFPTEQSNDYIGNGREGTLRAFGEQQQYWARAALALVDDVIALNFVDAGTDVNADTRFYNSTLEGTAGGAPAGTGLAGDVWIYNYDLSDPETENNAPGGYNFFIILHELGHTLGLSHTGGYPGGGYQFDGHYIEDNNAYTVMSYNSASYAGISWDSFYASTLMMGDIAALQSIYGVDTTTRTGDDVYGFNSNITDRLPYNFDMQLALTGRGSSMTIWDAGGDDTLDMSGYDEDAYIDLAPGSFSNVGGFEMNVAIAHGVDMENAVAGNGNDIMAGNTLANRLEGRAGTDRMFGGYGNDTLIGDGDVGFLNISAINLVSMNNGNGTDARLQTASTALTNTGSFTFEFVWNQEVAQDQSYSLDIGNLSIYRYDSGEVGVVFWGASGRGWFYNPLGKFNADNVADRISIRLDAEAGTLAFFLNGYLQQSSTVDASSLNISASGRLSMQDFAAAGDVRYFDYARSNAAIHENAFGTLIDPQSDAGLLHY